MGIHIAHPETKGRRRRKPTIDVDASEPTPLQILVAEANAKRNPRVAAKRSKAALAYPGGLGMDLERIDKLAPDMTEDEFARFIIAYAKRYGWLADCKRQGIEATHTPKGVNKDDWDEIGNGIPDWILIHEERCLLVFWEAKKEKKPSKLREKQVRWGSGLGAIASWNTNVIYKVISPADWPYVKAILRGH